MRDMLLGLACGTLLASVAWGASTGAEVARGKVLYQARCSACHSLDVSRVGPLHRNVVGRRAGSVAGFDYSDALRKAQLTWDEQTLDKWLTDPEAFLPGQKMDVSVASPEDRHALIAYLKSESGRPASVSASASAP